MGTYIRFVALASLIATAPAVARAADPLSADWRVANVAGEGQWAILDRSPLVVWQGCADGVTTRAVVPAIAGAGNVWRCFVEPGARTQSAGICFAAAPDLAQGFVLSLGGAGQASDNAKGGVILADMAGAVIWEDRFAPWNCYTPYLIEGIVESGRVRVQVFNWDAKTLISQSDWIERPDAQPAPEAVLALATTNATARFYGWARAETPSSDIVADSPTKLRLVTDDKTPWRIIGDGAWRWTTPEHKVLRQNASVERTWAVNTAIGGAEGTWRCRVRVEREAGGAGMLIQGDPDAERGFIVWLGGAFGAGALMLYRRHGDAIWSSPQDLWHYNEECVLEGTIRGGKISARMLAADGAAVIAASPEFDLTPEENGRQGYVGFHTWKGPAEFWDFSDDTRADAPQQGAPAPEAAGPGEGWSTIGGTWQWADPQHTMLAQSQAGGTASALNANLKATKGAYRVAVKAGEGAEAVSLVFQASADLSLGFEVRLGKGLLLREVGGRDLWRAADLNLEAGKTYLIEGQVDTDRVRARVYDDAGNALAQSEDCYVSDKNNTREGVLGVRTENGAAQFTAWNVEPAQ